MSSNVLLRTVVLLASSGFATGAWAQPSATKAPNAQRTAAALKPLDRAAFEAAISKRARELMVPGALVLVRTPEQELRFGYGATELGGKVAPQGKTYFRIASNTKTMTAAVVLQLAQEGKLSLADPVSKYVAEVPGGERITIANLLQMRSGLYNYTSDPGLAETLDRDPTKAWTPEELLAIAFRHPPTSPPDTEFEYDNTNYALLGLVIEKVDGRPLATAYRTRLFETLGLQNTFLPASNMHTLPAPFAHGYLYGGASHALVDADYPAELQRAARSGELLPRDFTQLNHSFAAAAGGVVSTADDLAIWIRALATGKVLNVETQRTWLASLRPEDPAEPAGQHYGDGIAKLQWGPNAMLFHGGETPGYNSFIGYDPTNEVTLIVWTNLTIALDGQPTANALMLQALDQLYTYSPIAKSR